MKTQRSSFVFIGLLFVTCNFHPKEILVVEPEDLLPSLDSGVVYLQPFDTLIYLNGEKALDDTFSIFNINREFTSISLLDPPMRLYNDYFSRYYQGKILTENNDLIYFKDSLIVSINTQTDSVSEKIIYHLSLYPHIGSLIVNSIKNRMIFAHEYHHLFHIMDLEGKTVKTVDFNNGNHIGR